MFQIRHESLLDSKMICSLSALNSLENPSFVAAMDGFFIIILVNIQI